MVLTDPLRIAATAAAAICLHAAHAQVPTTSPAAATPPPIIESESTLTAEQIFARQKETYAHIRTAQGEAVWREEVFDSAERLSTEPLRLIVFATDSTHFNTCVYTWDGRTAPASPTGTIVWRNLLTASLILDDVVLQFAPPAGPGQPPRIEPSFFNPAIHESNPLAAFHPRLLGDEPIGLEELVAELPNMKVAPRVVAMIREGRELLRIEFTGDAPGEALYYIVNPARGFLNEEITRVRGGRIAVQTRLFIGEVSGVFIPARREKDIYNAEGRALRRESWYYRKLAINQPIEPRRFSAFYFGLSEDQIKDALSAAPAAAPRVR